MQRTFQTSTVISDLVALGQTVSPVDVFADLDFACRRIAETACQTTSRQTVSADVDPICSDLLTFGPANTLPGCRSIIDAIEEFNWSVREYCSQETDIIIAPSLEG